MKPLVDYFLEESGWIGICWMDIIMIIFVFRTLKYISEDNSK